MRVKVPRDGWSPASWPRSAEDLHQAAFLPLCLSDVDPCTLLKRTGQFPEIRGRAPTPPQCSQCSLLHTASGKAPPVPLGLRTLETSEKLQSGNYRGAHQESISVGGHRPPSPASTPGPSVGAQPTPELSPALWWCFQNQRSKTRPPHPRTHTHIHSLRDDFWDRNSGGIWA